MGCIRSLLGLLHFVTKQPQNDISVLLWNRKMKKYEVHERKMMSPSSGSFEFNSINETLVIKPPLALNEKPDENIRAFFGAFMIHTMTQYYIYSGGKHLEEDQEQAMARAEANLALQNICLRLTGDFSSLSIEKLRDIIAERLRFSGLNNPQRETLKNMGNELNDIEQQLRLYSAQQKQRREEIFSYFNQQIELSPEESVDKISLSQSTHLDLESRLGEFRYTIGGLTLIDKVNDPKLYIVATSGVEKNYVHNLYPILIKEQPLLDHIVSQEEKTQAIKIELQVNLQQQRKLSSCARHISENTPSEPQNLTVLTKVVIANAYQHYPSYGAKYMKCVSDKVQEKQNFKGRLDGLIKEQVSILEDRKQILQKKVEQHDHEIQNKSHTSSLPLIIWLQLLFCGTPTQRKQKAEEKKSRIEHEIIFVNRLQKLNNLESNEAEAKLKEIQQSDAKSDRPLLEKNLLKSCVKNIIYSSRTSAFFYKVQKMSHEHAKSIEEITREMQHIERSVTVQAA